ncbi:MAG TPA: agmatinase [Burkholderiaceae bacterium]|nr:agmatinase [Burkholderiaceae bacterium]
MMPARFTPPYSSDHSFLGAARDEPAGASGRNARFAIAGVAYDGAVTNRPGARFGPAAIRAASRMLCDAIHPLYDCSPRDALIDVGDLQLPVTSLEQHRTALQAAAQRLLAACHVCWLGGDHSITLPILRAHRACAGRPLAIVHLDAHCDTWSDHFGEPSGHGTWMREAIQERLVIPEAAVQIGIRSPAASETREFVQRNGGRVISARDLRGRDNAQQLAGVIEEVRARVAGRDRHPVYLSLDIDCLDPAFAPGTGTPEVGGLSTVQVLTLLEGLADVNWVGMDCVEVAPAYDHADITSLAAATFVWTYLCGRLRAPSV